MATQNSGATPWNVWLEVEPVTDGLEPAFLNPDGVKTEARGTMYCRDAGFFLPPLEGFQLPSCASRCSSDDGFDQLPECGTCFVKVSKKAFISAVQLDEHGNFKAIRLSPANECFAEVADLIQSCRHEQSWK